MPNNTKSELSPFLADLIDDNGKTVYENNMAVQHKIPVGTLVEVKYAEWYGEGACEKIHARLFVIAHERDCDGTPLYLLGPQMVENYKECPFSTNEIMAFYFWRLVRGIAEESLTPIEVTQAIRDGVGSLEWEREK